MTAPDVATIAAGLSKAQRQAVLVGGNTPADDLAFDRPGIARQLHDLGLTFVDFSPLGYALRHYLEQEQGRG